MMTRTISKNEKYGIPVNKKNFWKKMRFLCLGLVSCEIKHILEIFALFQLSAVKVLLLRKKLGIAPLPPLQPPTEASFSRIEPPPVVGEELVILN